ncbi:hypothetical protein PLICRDRAFT_86044 [Plicaturopsis crispa FD-325 SS-3]|nr:hypothetical protein PLICRDRAFT_86044 [Plicaturopsis crispa FD-325 SS-3]
MSEVDAVPQPSGPPVKPLAPRSTTTFPIAINAVQSVTIKSVSLELKRVLPSPIKVNVPPTPGEDLPDGLPPLPPSSLPAPGNLQVAITFRKQLGKGRSSLVYAIDVSPDVGLPPLVAKVARIGHQSSLIREAAIYERLECIQGLVVPLFYGTFEGHLEDGCELDLDQKLMKYEEDPDTVEEIEELSPDCEERMALAHRRRDAEKPNWICISLLERLGKYHLPLGKRIPKSIKNDIYEEYEDITALCVIHEDIRYANILSAGPSTKGAVCPWHGYAHRYRVLDFEDAQLWAATDRYLRRSWGETFLRGILSQLPLGNIWERWHF